MPSVKKDASAEAAASARELIARFRKLRSRLLAWFRENQRDYPWRKTGNWFHLLMAEMMLRRTRADQVRPVYERFTERYGAPADAAGLKKSELEKMLRPLGLRWRAEQLYDTIHYLKDTYAVRAIAQEDNLRDIPGVGEYADAMLRNRLFDERIATVDSNVVRIFSRWQNYPYHRDARRNRDLIDLANRFVNSKRSKELNLALLDFSALVCRPRKADCPACPLKTLCSFYLNSTDG